MDDYRQKPPADNVGLKSSKFKMPIRDRFKSYQNNHHSLFKIDNAERQPQAITQASVSLHLNHMQVYVPIPRIDRSFDKSCTLAPSVANVSRTEKIKVNESAIKTKMLKSLSERNF